MENSFFIMRGVTPSVTNVINAVDSERKNIASIFDHKLPNIADSFHSAGFGIKGNLMETISSSDMLTSLKAPGVVNHRWLTEDISYGIYTWSLIGEKFEVPTETMSNIISLASVLLGFDLKENSRSLDDLGIKNLSLDEIKRNFIVTFSLIQNQVLTQPLYYRTIRLLCSDKEYHFLV